VRGLVSGELHPVEQREQMRDGVAFGAGECPGQWNAAAVYEEVLLAAAAAPADRAWTRLRATFSPAHGRSRRSPVTTRSLRRMRLGD
jgi:hypothetical protein